MGWLIASVIASALIGGGVALFSNHKTNKINQQIASENISFQQQENELAREREDNAVQRRAEDLEAAGLSKTLAAGSAASSNLMTAPHNDYVHQDEGQALLSGISQGAQVAQQIAQVQNTVANTQHTNLVNANYERKLNSDINVQESQARLNNAQSKLREFEGEHQAEKFEKEMDKLISETLKNTESALLSKKEREYINQKVINDIVHNEHVSAQTQKVLEDICKVKLDYKVMDYNLNWAKGYDLPVGVANENMMTMLRRQDSRNQRSIKGKYGPIPEIGYNNGGYVW